MLRRRRADDDVRGQLWHVLPGHLAQPQARHRAGARMVRSQRPLCSHPSMVLFCAVVALRFERPLLAGAWAAARTLRCALTTSSPPMTPSLVRLFLFLFIDARLVFFLLSIYCVFFSHQCKCCVRRHAVRARVGLLPVRPLDLPPGPHQSQVHLSHRRGTHRHCSATCPFRLFL